MAEGMIVPRADVVICTYAVERWDLLVRAADSVLVQSVAPQQLVIVVDHNDELLQLCRAEWLDVRPARPIDIVVTPNRFAGRLGSARNTALLHSRSDVVVFLDDDAQAAPDWLERLLDVYTTSP